MSYSDPAILMGTEPYWQAANDGKLLIKRCADCGKAHFYPRPHCPHCWSDNVAWEQAAGTGTIYSYSVMRRADPVYVIAYVTLTEGVSMLTNLIESDPDSLAIGQAVRLVFRPSESGQALPFFTPEAGA